MIIIIKELAFTHHFATYFMSDTSKFMHGI